MTAQSVRITEQGNALEIEWQSGKRAVLDARRLWRGCPSAQARRIRIEQPGIAPDPNLRIVSFQPIGLYAINIAFSDGNDRGIYPWSLLREFASEPTVEDFLLDAIPA